MTQEPNKTEKEDLKTKSNFLQFNKASNQHGNSKRNIVPTKSLLIPNSPLQKKQLPNPNLRSILKNRTNMSNQNSLMMTLEFPSETRKMNIVQKNNEDKNDSSFSQSPEKNDSSARRKSVSFHKKKQVFRFQKDMFDDHEEKPRKLSQFFIGGNIAHNQELNSAHDLKDE
jgi:hypothetical protein